MVTRREMRTPVYESRGLCSNVVCESMAVFPAVRTVGLTLLSKTIGWHYRCKFVLRVALTDSTSSITIISGRRHRADDICNVRVPFARV